MLRSPTLALAAGALALPALAIAAAPTAALAADVKVRVSGVDGRGGDMRVEVCTPATFLKECPYRAKVPAQQGTMDVIVKDVPPGTYAVTAHHDINRNGKVDQNLLGVPKEGVGFSRNPMLILRAPRFDETSITVGDTLAEVDITLKFEP